MSAKQTFRLSEAPRETRKYLEEHGLTPARPIPGYWAFWRGVVEDRIPAERAADGRSYELRRSDLPVIAEALGLVAASAAVAVPV